MNLLYLDTETFSEADLKKVGSYAYAEHPTTEIVICTYAFDEGPVQVWDATDGSDMPRDLRRAMLKLQKPDSNLKLVGQNFLMFDRPVIKHCWGFELLVENIIDTMIVAFRHALPGSLAALCEVLNIDASMAKDKRGKALIQRFSKPTPKNYKIRRYTADTHPKEWAEFIAYAKSDITSMREVYKKMPKWGNSEFEDRVLWLDQVINDRGFKVDVALAEAAIEAVTRHKEELQEEAQRKYGGSLTGKDFLPILQELAPAHRIHNAQKSTLNDLLADEDLPDDARTIIEMRLGAASTASTKYAPLLLGRSSDDRRRGCLQYGGAKRTLRWAGKGFQPQNLARGYYHDDELDRGIAALLKGRAHRRFDVAKLTASTVRSCIIPEAGRKFVVADYSNVEGRGLAWLAGEDDLIEVFVNGVDVYKKLASTVFNVAYEDVTKDQRQISKAMVLGLGYAGGVGAFVTFAKNLGLDLNDMARTLDGTFPDHIWAATARGYEWARIQEAKRPPRPGEKDDRPSYILDKKVWRTCDALKRMYREANPAIVQFWRDVEDAAMAAIRNPGKEFTAGPRGVKFSRNVETDNNGNKVAGWWLRMTLPSGRVISYPGVGLSVSKETDEDGKVSTNVRIKYQGENQLTRQWGLQYTYSGKLVENCTQALCRDLLANALLNVEANGYPIVLHVHDEVICETPDTPDYTVAELEKLMCELPEWAEGFPLVAEGAELKRYAK
ncbi:DNA polymerase [Salmonella virus VSt10]|uniref:DNA polymerase n=1 Tax=Salmonella virus VSt10 TaxID=2301722 RepID=A0A385EH53_9CAUD|nr:DNA polymerase [Salmonella virus VSt10]AXQ70297.1 DNA polymerase [Salmonella virus VSt10]